MPPNNGEPKEDLVSRGMRWWRQERPDIDSSGKAVVGRLLRLQDLALRRLNEAIASHGLKYQEYGVLATLRVKGAPFQMTPSELQSTLLYSSGGLSNLLKRLEREGYIQRAIHPADGRGVLVKLTSKGRRLADKAMPAHAQAELALIAMFEPAERELLAGLLARMTEGNTPEAPAAQDAQDEFQVQQQAL
jgi:DNA-binding MarR family transcriptional regulator